MWVQGTDYVYERGSMALNNCAFCSVKKLSYDAAWIMDALMMGVGVGFDTHRADILLQQPKDDMRIVYQIPDTREGWVESVRLLIASYEQGTEHVDFDYGLVRPAGEPIRGFGGVASGPEPLEQLHRKLRSVLSDRADGRTSSVRCIADSINLIAKCVVAGNVRRSALIALGRPNDTEFLDLKDWRKPENAERMDWQHGWGHTSNNSVVLESADDFDYLPNVAHRVGLGGEPGILNVMNVQKYGRMGHKKPDAAIGINPSLRKGTLVYTSHGIVPIETLEGTKFTVRNLDNQMSVAECFLSGKNKPLYEIVLANGKSYFATEEHKWPVVDRTGRISKVTTVALKAGAMLPVLKNTSLSFGTEGSYNEGFLAGWITGDGWITYTNGRKQIGMILAEDDLEIQDKLEATLKEIGCESTFKRRERNGSVTYEVNTQSQSLVKWCEKFGVGGKKEGIPSSIWTTASEDFRKGFIDGLYSSDGCVGDRLSLVSAHKTLLEDVQTLLGFYGINGTIQSKEVNGVFPNGKDYGKTYQFNQFRIGPNSDFNHFGDTFSLSLSRKNVKLQTKRAGRRRGLMQVKEVRLTNLKEDVWDITVHDNTHCFQLAYSMTGNCGEIPLEDKELCNLVEVFPTRCKTEHDFLEAIELATIYSSSVSLLRTHSTDTNAVVAKNRRIGVSISGIPDWMASVERKSDIVRLLNAGYELVERTNLRLAIEAGVPPSVRLTTVKPSGTISLLAGVSPGMHHPIFQTYIRRVKFGTHSPVVPLLLEAGVPYEPDDKDPNGTMVFEFPIHMKGVRPQNQVSLAEHGLRLILISRFWTDNAASNTSNFRGSMYDDNGKNVPFDFNYPNRKQTVRGEEEEIESWLTMVIPHVKSSSMLPYYNGANVYRQQPYEEISYDEFEKRRDAIQEIDWTRFEGSDGEDSRYCEGDNCVI